MDPKAILLDLFDIAVAVAQPAKRLPALLPPLPKGRTVVIGAGKAAAEMAAQLERVWAGPLSGVVVTRYGHAVPCKHITVLEASHPFPDENSVEASQALYEAVSGLGADDLVISLISGGGSALLAWPVEGVTLADKQALTRALFAAGATIRELNTVRQQLSRIKGGRLAAAAWPAQVVTLLISDVPGDCPALIASGPTVEPAAAAESAEAIVERLGVEVPSNVAEALRRPVADFPHGFGHCRSSFIATPMQSLQAAAERARALGLNAIVLSDQIEGEASEVAQVHAGIARSVLRYGSPLARPAVILSGGETTVSFDGAEGGRGGRNAEFLLALGHALRDEQRVWAIACDTDGRDGSEDNAGAVWSGDSIERARALGVDPRIFLDGHDSYSFFQQMGDLVVTGPTQTNVNDFRAIYLPAD